MPRRTSCSGWSWVSLGGAGLLVAFGLFPARAAGSPMIRVDGLQQGSAYSGPHVPFIIAFRASAPDRRVTRLEISIDGRVIDQKIQTPAAAEGAWKVNWDTTAWADGKHTLTVRAYDEAGESGTFSLHVYVNNNGPDLTPPTIRITHPAPGQEVSGRVPVRVKADDNVGIQWVIIYVDQDYKRITNAPPYLWEWDTTREENGPHEVWAQAIDASDLESESERVPVIVNNPGASGNLTQIQGRNLADVARPMAPTAPLAGRMAATPRPHFLPPRASQTRVPQVPLPEEPVLGSARQPAAAPPLLSLALPASFPAEGSARFPGKAMAPRFGPVGWSQPAVPALPRLATGQVPPLEPLGLSVDFPVPEAVSSFSPALSWPREARPLISRSEGSLPSAGVAPAATPAVPIGTGPRMTVERRPRMRIEPPAGQQALPEVREAPDSQPSTPAPKLSALEPPGPAAAALAEAPVATVPVASGPTVGLPDPARSGIAAAVGAAAPRRGTPPQMAPDVPAPTLPGPPKASLPGPLQAARVQPTIPAAAPARLLGRVHVVQAGENVYRIAKRYGTTVEQIARVNRLGRDYRIQPGQRLVLPQPTWKGIVFDERPIAADVSPFQQRSIPVAPFRPIFEHQGGVVDWKPASKEVEARDAKRTIHLTIGSREAQVNQETILMDLAAFIERGRTMVPLRFIGQALDVTVQVDPDSGNIYLTSNR